MGRYYGAGDEYPPDEDGVVDWIIDSYAVVDEWPSGEELPESYIEAYRAFREYLEEHLSSILGEDVDELFDDEGADSVAVDVWHDLGDHGVGVWDGRWDDYLHRTTAQKASDALRRDAKLVRLYEVLETEASNAVFDATERAQKRAYEEERAQTRGSRRARLRKLNTSLERDSWCLFSVVFTDTDDDYGYLTWHVVQGGEEAATEFLHEQIGDESSDFWPAWAAEEPWAGDSVEHAGDGFFYKSIPEDLLVDPDELEGMTQEEIEEEYPDSATIVVQVRLVRCFATPEDAFRHLYTLGTAPNGSLWGKDPELDDDDIVELETDVSSYDVVHRGRRFDEYMRMSPRRLRLRSLNRRTR